MTWATEHCRDKKCSVAKLKVAERKRPDQRFVLDDGNVITDLSFTGSIDPRAPKADEHVGAFRSLLKKREQAKNKNYKGRVHAAGETFYPVVSTCNGTLGDSAVEFLKEMYNNRSSEHESLTIRKLTVDFKRMVHSVSAMSLMNAEKKLGVIHLKQKHRIDPGDSEVLSSEAPAASASTTASTTTSSATTAASGLTRPQTLNAESIQPGVNTGSRTSSRRSSVVL